ncbi:MAG: hypothetical protein ABW033_00500, partial [Acidimicrobiia bacterium]
MTTFRAAVHHSEYLPPGATEVNAIVTFRATGAGDISVSAALRVWTPQSASVRFVRQVAPTIDDLTTRRIDIDE